jgi:hypothetical protein
MISHRDWDPKNTGTKEPQECFCLPKINCWKLPCDMGRFLIPKSRVKIWWTVNRFELNSLLIILNVKMTVRSHILARFWGWTSYNTRFVFHLFSAL